MKIIGLCVGLLIGFGACQSHRDTIVGIRAEGIPVNFRFYLRNFSGFSGDSTFCAASRNKG